MTHIKIPKRDSIHFFSANKDITINISEPFADNRILFLKSLSKNILSNSEAKKFPDLVTFGYWCRPSNIKLLKQKYDDLDVRLGLGLAFHVAPSNVPLNFAFSFVFSLLAGNSNIIRMPSRGFDQVNAFLQIYNETVQEYEDINNSNVLLNYDSNDIETTEFFSLNADARIFWGGDLSVSKLKQIISKERAIDVIFSDRHSGSIIDVDTLSRATPKEFERLTHNLYNDIFLMDQNACSSPRVIFWKGGSNNAYTSCKDELLSSVLAIAKKKYSIEASQVISKFNNACKHSIQSSGESKININDGYLFTQNIFSETSKLDAYDINSGYILETRIRNLEGLLPYLDKKFQTMGYFGISKSELKLFIGKHKPIGIDRFTPIGSALDIGIIWDGFDLIRTLSRIIQIS